MGCRSGAGAGDATVRLEDLPDAAAHRVLRIGVLREHDAERGTDYLTTIRTWLELDRSWQRAAAELPIHKQTLGYRLRRIEELTGRGLTSTGDLAAWWLGVRSDQLLRLAALWDAPGQ